MSAPPPQLLVLDVHGVVLTTPLVEFLDELARAIGQSAADVRRRWREELRTAAWTSELTDEDLWARLAAGDHRQDWRALLESKYGLGPAVPHLQRWAERVPLWLLSNHRSQWLLPRLRRFGLCQYFDNVIVSDLIRAAKPDSAAYQPILDAVGDVIETSGSALFVDDRLRNVRAARSLGVSALLADAEGAWIDRVDQALGCSQLSLGD